MSTLSHPTPETASEHPEWSARLLVAEMWASLAIVAMWVVVAISAVWGPDFVSSSGSGATTTTIPSGIAVAVFATIGSWIVAKYGFRHDRAD